MQIKKILLVDDDPNIRKVAVVCLQKIGKWDVLSAASGFDALTLAVDYKPDLIILDVMMPGMDGFEVLSRLKNNPLLADIPVIFMTALAQTRDLTKCMAWGARGVIPKPFNPMLLPEQMAILSRNESDVRVSA